MGRRRLYVPITRSGSSILASIFTQLIDEGRRQRQEELKGKLASGEISPGWAFIQMHWVFCLMLFAFFMIMFGGLTR